MFTKLRHNAAYMNREQIDALIGAYLDAELHEVEERLATRTPDLAPPNQWGFTQTDLEHEAVRESAVAVHGALQANDLRETLPLARGLVPGADETTVAVLARRLLEARMQALDAELAGLLGKPLVGPKSTVAPPQSAAPRTSPPLSKMVSDYAAFKQAGGKWTDKTRSQLVNLYRVMTEIIGDKQVHAVTKDNMRALYRLMPQMPAHATKRYPGMVAIDAIAAADADGNDERLSPKTQNDYFTHIKSLWKLAAENDYVEKSSAVVLKDVDETAAWDQRPPFSDEQLTRYFVSCGPEQVTTRRCFGFRASCCSRGCAPRKPRSWCPRMCDKSRAFTSLM
jgi:hypothetical protein